MKNIIKILSLLVLVLQLTFVQGVDVAADTSQTIDKPDNVICVVELRLKSGAKENYNIYAGKDVDVVLPYFKPPKYQPYRYGYFSTPSLFPTE